MSKSARVLSLVSFLAAGAIAMPAASATEVPYTETFNAGHADWYDHPGLEPLSWSPDGGPDGSGHVWEVFNFVNSREGEVPAFFRAQDEFNSSGGAFVGNWIGEGVTEFSSFVRHDLPFPVTFYVRFSSPVNFPGAIAIIFQPVMPATWTKLTIAIDPDNPQFVTYEGSDFETVFSDIGHVQIGVQVSRQMEGFNGDFTFQLDDAAIAGGRTCGGQEKLKVRCKAARCGNQVTAKLKNGLPGTDLTFTLDDGDARVRTVKNNGSAKVKWCPAAPGNHEVAIVECEVRQSVRCR